MKWSYKLVIWMFVLQIPIIVFSQDGIDIVIAKNDVLQTQEERYNKFGVCSARDDMHNIVVSKNSSKRKFLFRPNSSSDFKELTILKSDISNEIFSDYINSATLIGHQYLVLTNNHIFNATVDFETSELTIVSVIKNTNNYAFSKQLGENVFISCYYNFHVLDAKYKHLWAIYDLNSSTITNETVMSDFDVKFTHFSNKFFDVFDDKIIFSESTNYRIGIYNQKFEKIDSICSSELLNDSKLLKKTKVGFLDSKDDIIKLKKIDDSLFTRIVKVYYMNETGVLVLLKNKSDQDFRFDYWQKEDNVWIKKSSQNFKRWYTQGEGYSSTDYNIVTEFFQNQSDLVYLGDNVFEYIYFPYVPTVETESFDRQTDYLDIQNQNLIKHRNEMGRKHLLIKF